MKKAIIICVLIFISLAYQSCSPSSFATVGNNGWKVTLYHYTPDVKIQENGQDCAIIGDAFAGYKKAGYATYGTGVAGSGGYLLYTNGIQLDKSSETHQITLTRGDKTATVTIGRKSSPFIDVTATLGESKTMSFSDLQKEYVKEYGKKKKKKE